MFTSHGLAFKSDYNGSWRGVADNNQNYNIVMTKSIHYVDLLIDIVGKPKSVTINPLKGQN